MKKTLAARLVWSRITAFSLAHYSGDHAINLKEERWYSTYTPKIGSLVAIQSARPSEWCLSWMVEFQPSEHGVFSNRYLLESVETGKLCWWSNVSFLEYGGTVHDSWRWTDAQHKFNNRWMRESYRHPDYYINRPVPATFKDYAVTIGIRTMFKMDDVVVYRTFEDFRKVKVKDLIQAFTDMCRERDELRKKPANEAAASSHPA